MLSDAEVHWLATTLPRVLRSRVVTRFAVIPKRMPDGKLVWLRRYRVEQDFIAFECAAFRPDGNHTYSGRWVDKESAAMEPAP